MAEEEGVVDVGETLVFPVDDVVGIAAAGVDGAAGEGAVLVTDLEGDA